MAVPTKVPILSLKGIYAQKNPHRIVIREGSLHRCDKI